VSAYDLATGELKYSSPALPVAGPAQQQGLFCGLDGKVYACRPSSPTVSNSLYALRDTGTALEIAWQYPSGYGVFGSFGVGRNGLIYVRDRDGRIIQLNPDDGSLAGQTVAPLPGAGSTDFSPRVAVDRAGHVFASNGSSAAGAIAAYDAHLSFLWSESIGTQSITGPALGPNGELVVQTRTQGMIVYRSAFFKLGDANCDRVTDFDDIDPFVLALSDPFEWQLEYPGCALQNADINGDGAIDFSDIDPFVALLTGG
jgi:PAS domain-containing protein